MAMPTSRSTSKAGSGGYTLNEFEPGVRARVEKFANYWRSDRAHVDEAEVLAIHDTAARSNALLTGEVDAIDSVDARLADVLSSRSEMVVEETSGPLHYDFPMRVNVAPFDDNNVRLALKYAVDREAMVKTILRGRGRVGNDSPIGPSYRYYAAGIEQRAYDPDKAKFHLKQAGLSELKVDLSAANAAFTGAVDTALLFKEQARAAGIDINVVREPNDGYWSEVWNKKPWCASYWAGYPTEDFMLSAGYYSKSEYNATAWHNERFDSLLLAARAELDEAKRLEMYTEMQSLIRDVGGVLVPCFANDVLARNKKIAHGKLSNQRGFDGRKIIERWWVV
jgi:peptide/nickel transport system substrate-binding protein